MLAVGAVCAGVWAVFGSLLAADFLRWDDYQVIVLNPVVRRGLLWVIWSDPLDGLYIPVTYSLWANLWSMSAGQPWLFHAANLVLHAINATLVLRIGLKLTESTGAHGVAATLLGAAVFAVHPLQVETVAWITCCRDLLAAAFALGALAILLESDTPRRLMVSSGLFLLALLSKPTIAVAPVAFAAILLGAGLGSRRRLVALALWLVPAVAAVLVNKAIQQRAADLRQVTMPLLQRLWIACDSLSFYASKLVWPHPLAADYGRTPARALAALPSLFGLGTLVVVIARAAGDLTRGRRLVPGLFAAALIFTTPTLGLVPFQAQGLSTVADRYAYLMIACVGWLIAVVAAPLRPQLLAPAVAVVCLLAGVTVSRLPVWQTNDAFFTDMVAKNPQSLGGLSSLAVERRMQDRIDESEALYRRALQIDPFDVHAVGGLIDIELARGQDGRAAAEFLPLFEDEAFLAHNELDAMPLAHAYRLAARLSWQMQDWQRANDLYCRSFAIYFDSGERQEELQAFLAAARRHGADLKLDPKYEAPRRRPRMGDGWKGIAW
ncbi:hypothetical protein EBR56_02640 [bacterium]|nr:hypothetical protein [bacterium]